MLQLTVPLVPSSHDIHDVVGQAARVLKHGGLVAYPTETVYGLGACVFNEEAVARVYRAKGRPAAEGLPVLIATLADLELVARDIPPAVDAFVRRFWPGPLTLVLERHPHLPRIVTGGQDTVAVRLPNHSVPRALVLESGHPITGTSANRSGRPNPLVARDVLDQMGDTVDMIIDGGRCPEGLPSTILDMTKYPPIVLRHGVVPEEALRSVGPVGLITVKEGE